MFLKRRHLELQLHIAEAARDILKGQLALAKGQQGLLEILKRLVELEKLKH